MLPPFRSQINLIWGQCVETEGGPRHPQAKQVAVTLRSPPRPHAAARIAWCRVLPTVAVCAGQIHGYRIGCTAVSYAYCLPSVLYEISLPYCKSGQYSVLVLQEIKRTSLTNKFYPSGLSVIFTVNNGKPRQLCTEYVIWILILPASMPSTGIERAGTSILLNCSEGTFLVHLPTIAAHVEEHLEHLT